MKTTVEISDQLLRRSQRIAKSEGSTLRALLEEGLRLVLKARQSRLKNHFVFPTFGDGGLSDEFRNASWSAIRETIYRDANRDQNHGQP